MTTWELKDVSTVKSADSALRKGLKRQYSVPEKNRGGIILNYGQHNVNLDEVKISLDSRMNHNLNKSAKIFIIKDGKIVEIFYYDRV